MADEATEAGLPRDDWDRCALAVAQERAVWDARREELIFQDGTSEPTDAKAAVIVYGIAVRHLTGRCPIA